MGRLIDSDDLADAQELATLLGLSHANSFHTYVRRNSDIPSPIVDKGKGRSRLWLRSEVIEWMKTKRRTRWVASAHLSQ